MPGKEPALEELFFHVSRTYYAYKNLLEQVLAEQGLDRHLRPGMGHLLFALFEEDDVIITDIARRTRLSFPTITVLLQQMEKSGVVERRRDPGDGRAVRVRLTPLGRSLEPRCRKVVRRLKGVVEAKLSDGEVRIVKRALGLMTESMRAAEAKERLRKETVAGGI
jgi:DNA-binding MarR family transcriptional regulator